ncbi:MAG TPA: hypothetical protein VM759_05220, partial [Longimicrobium sp.]|nr:hypothetical protein [Longimicrobium sp.]
SCHGAPAVVAALDAAVPGAPWQESRHQRAVAPSADGVDLVSVLSPKPLGSDEPAKVSVTLTTYGMDAAAFDTLRAEWEQRWSALVSDPKFQP